MKKVLSLLLTVLALTGLVLSAAAAEPYGYGYDEDEANEFFAFDYDTEEYDGLDDFDILSENDASAAFIETVTALGPVTDYAQLLTQTEKQTLENRLRQIKDETGMDTVILTLNDASACNEFTIYSYLEAYFTENFSGSGAALIMNMAERDWQFIFFGAADNKGKYSDEWVTETVRQYLSDGKYEKAFLTFAEIANDVYTCTENTKKYKTLDWKTGLVLSVIVGVIAAFAGTSGMKREMNSVQMQSNANDYTVGGSLNLSLSKDVFLYRNVTRVPRPKPTAKTGGAGRTGGGGTHSGGGKF